ncbi:type II toxin-antitoxin system RelE/ParE family toxin [Embleya sp. NPDC020630]|uniref:type II toxin-antitoxin system RelE/ParE family toxin n=1 Tax=Embleya sp. NPDC020630 TaxID=3363979 RepID=UPI0037A967DA
MSYTVDFVGLALRQRNSMPRVALSALDTLVRQLERDPWKIGNRMFGGLNDTYEAAFGGYGMATYIIQDHKVTVTVINLVWAG